MDYGNEENFQNLQENSQFSSSVPVYLYKQGCQQIDLRIRMVKFHPKKMKVILINVQLLISQTDLNDILRFDSNYLSSHFCFSYFQF